MKILKWTTTVEYVDINTGEVLTKNQVEEEYIIIKKTKNTTTHERYNSITKSYYTTGLVTITNECTKLGKQLNVFKHH